MKFFNFIFILQVFAKDDLLLYGGGCAVVSNKLYYLGGSSDFTKVEVNSKSYVLRLGHGFSLDSNGKAPWSEVGQATDQQKSYGGSVLAQGDNSNLIYVVGGRDIQAKENGFQTFDIGTNTWQTNAKATTNFSRLNSNATYSYSFSSLSRNDVNTTEYILYGGQLQVDSEKFMANANLLRFKSNDNTWIMDKSTGPSIYAHTASVYKGKLYLFGGFDISKGSSQSLTKISTYDLETKTWSDTTTSGDMPSARGGHASVQVKNTLYLIGGSSSSSELQPQSDGVFSLNLDTFKWSNNRVDNLIGSYLGCMVQYNGQLISAFGLTENKVESTQLIGLNKFNLVTTLEGAGPGANNDNSTNTNTNTNSTNTTNQSETSPATIGVLVGSVIGGVAAIVILGLTIFILIKVYQKKKHEAYLASIPMIENHVWVQSPPDPSKENTDMTLATDTNYPEFDNNMGTSTRYSSA